MTNQITGRVHFVGQPETITSQRTGNSIVKRLLVLDATRLDQYTGERGYDNFPSFEFVGERAAMLDNLVPGQVVVVSFDIQGNYVARDNRYFNSVRGYRVELRQTPAAPATPVASIAPTAPAPYPQQPFAAPAQPTVYAPPAGTYTPPAQYGTPTAPAPAPSAAPTADALPFQ